MRDLFAGNIEQFKPTNILFRSMKNGKYPLLQGSSHRFKFKVSAFEFKLHRLALSRKKVKSFISFFRYLGEVEFARILVELGYRLIKYY